MDAKSKQGRHAQTRRTKSTWLVVEKVYTTMMSLAVRDSQQETKEGRRNDSIGVDKSSDDMCRIVAARYMVSSKFPSHILPNQCEVMSVRMFLRSIPHLAGQGAFDWHPEASCI